ncbi:MAG: AAC(3) family N-acetyltransferase [Clostridia bacterium]|nr:AAC(3) family N-acetyltransferase [Clostridia bacterium]
MKTLYTKADLFSQLDAMRIPRDRVVLMHSSLRLIGNVEGGTQGLLDALIEYFTEEGGLFCVPTHTWMSLDEEITLDLSDPKTCLGAFSDFCAADPRAIRSEHPSHSMAVFGDRDRALAFVKDDATVTSCTSPDSCYGKIYDMGGTILLVGVSHNRNTYLHCIDEMLNIPNRMSDRPYTLTVKKRSGEVIARNMRMHGCDFTDDISLRFPHYEIPFRYHGAITDGFLGNAPTQACDARIMKNVMEMIFHAAGDEDPLRDERPIPPKWYV